MSENVDSQVEEVSPEVYRRRRIVAVLILVLVLLLIIGLISWLAGRGNSSDNATATASTSTSAEAFSDFSQRATESATPSESADPSASVSVSESASAEASESAEPTASASPTEAVVAACTAADLQVSLTADRNSYAAGQNPALAVTYTNTSGNPCIVTGGVNNVDVNITSGPAQVYNYAQCYADPVADAEVAAGATNTTALTWNRALNVLGCNTAATIQPGYYWATATVNGVTSQPVRIIVTG
ncbi:hypothetical protein E4U03_03375 [Rothia nasimurium]|uniref:DUF4232 domain-containing protein n=1 Tax=Rothia nasimurium TaxID=85336 RepID=A0A4Y9F575_9MICC|nr:hypothetical protein [Rothia nasimurium]MBF0807657.1 hypothetical protein [Rothia nasimurium]TFU23393.1 hypothetical protein E4U03_03375 [Rothia nasimurium]